MNLDDLTLGQIKEITRYSGNSSKEHPYSIGEAYLIRTVTHYYTGKIVKVFDTELLLSDGAWVADTGRYNEAITKGTLSEVEPIIGDFVIGRGAIIDAVKWPNNIPLPRNVK